MTLGYHAKPNPSFDRKNLCHTAPALTEEGEKRIMDMLSANDATPNDMTDRNLTFVLTLNNELQKQIKIFEEHLH